MGGHTRKPYLVGPYPVRPPRTEGVINCFGKNMNIWTFIHTYLLTYLRTYVYPNNCQWNFLIPLIDICWEYESSISKNVLMLCIYQCTCVRICILFRKKGWMMFWHNLHTNPFFLHWYIYLRTQKISVLVIITGTGTVYQKINHFQLIFPNVNFGKNYKMYLSAYFMYRIISANYLANIWDNNPWRENPT